MLESVGRCLTRAASATSDRILPEAIDPQGEGFIAMSIRPLRICVEYPVYPVMSTFGAMTKEHVQHFVQDGSTPAVFVRKAWQVYFVPEWRTEKHGRASPRELRHAEGNITRRAACFVGVSTGYTCRAADKLNSPASIQLSRYSTEALGHTGAGRPTGPGNHV